MKTFTFFLFLLFCIQVKAQQAAPFSAMVDRSSILIGEQFDLILDAHFPNLSTASFYQVDSLPHFEILAKSKIDTVSLTNEVVLSQRIILTSWDSGRWQLPSFNLAKGQVRTKPISITVSFTSPFDPKQDYHDVKDIGDVKISSPTSWYWYLIGAALIIILALILFPKNKKDPTENVIDASAYKKALAELQKIKAEGWEKKDPKTFYVQLVDVFRRYLHQGKGIQSFSKTTDDVCMQLKSLRLPADVYTRLVQELQLSDAVKFAKFQPSENEMNQSFIVIQKSIELIEQAK